MNPLYIAEWAQPTGELPVQTTRPNTELKMLRHSVCFIRSTGLVRSSEGVIGRVLQNLESCRKGQSSLRSIVKRIFTGHYQRNTYASQSAFSFGMES